jgi:hypothetical protein
MHVTCIRAVTTIEADEATDFLKKKKKCKNREREGEEGLKAIFI